MISQIVMKPLAKTAEKRYQTAIGVEQDLIGRSCSSRQVIRRNVMSDSPRQVRKVRMGAQKRLQHQFFATRTAHQLKHNPCQIRGALVSVNVPEDARAPIGGDAFGALAAAAFQEQVPIQIVQRTTLPDGIALPDVNHRLRVRDAGLGAPSSDLKLVTEGAATVARLRIDKVQGLHKSVLDLVHMIRAPASRMAPLR